jgi:hypothetical protein
MELGKFAPRGRLQVSAPAIVDNAPPRAVVPPNSHPTA